jgi:A/G-specific adenine glycosylase
MPWRVTRTPYRVFVSEIMLQQTSVTRVTARYSSFLRVFPSFRTLASSSVQEVISAWKGLGYNRRALALRESARQITTDFHGRLPRTVEQLVRLPGVGHATAAAVIVYTFNIPVVFIETNIRRVFLHAFFPDKENVPDSVILPLVEKTMDRENPRDWFYALMDYGTALAAERAGRQRDPNRRSSRYRVQSPFKGSLRQLRGRVLSVIIQKKTVTFPELEKALNADSRISEALRQLEQEGFLRLSRGRYAFR